LLFLKEYLRQHTSGDGELQIVATEGTGGFNPLETGPNLEAFRPGFKHVEASTTYQARVDFAAGSLNDNGHPEGWPLPFSV
jgi:hypothetical protein